MRKLEYLNLSDNLLGPLSGQALFEYFESQPAVESLHLHNNSFTPANLKSFLLNLNNYSKLDTLDLSWNKLGGN